MKKKNLAFTLAEVLIVIGIIGVVAALTLPNLNHATGDKETVTRLQKAYSILNEANDRAVAIYGPISTWKSNESCLNNFRTCYFQRLSEILKVSESCNETGDEIATEVSCDSLGGRVVYTNFWVTIGIKFSDGITLLNGGGDDYDCTTGQDYSGGYINDICFEWSYVDVNSNKKGKNKIGEDVFPFHISDSLGFIPAVCDGESIEDASSVCMIDKMCCTFWPLEFGNLDYLKADDQGYCNDNPSIKLDGVTNTSCH